MVDLTLRGTIEATGYSGGPVAGTTFTGTTFTGTTFEGTTFTGTTFEGTTFEGTTFTGTTFEGAKIKTTAEGGIAVKLTNKTGARSVKGQIVSHEGSVANAFNLTAVDANHCLGVVYESGVEDGAQCWVVVSGIAQVLMKNAATMGHICRIPLTADNGGAAGYAMDAAQSDTASVYKIGDVLETADAEVLCKVLLH